MTNFKRNPATMLYGAIIKPHVDPPAGLGCAIDTSTHPRWDKSWSNYIYGRDWFGLKILPAGRLPYYPFLQGNIGDAGLFWCKDALEYESPSPYYIIFGSANGIYFSYTTLWRRHSVRGVRDITEAEESHIDGAKYLSDYVDGSGNRYDGTKIGNQVWTTKNLHATHYQNGSDITGGFVQVHPHDVIEGINSEAEMVEYYGRLYRWETTNDDNLINNNGYLVPSKSDWEILLDYLEDEYSEIEDIWHKGMVLKSCRQVDHPLA